MIDDEEMYHCLEACKEFGAVAMVHAENGTIIKEVPLFTKLCRFYFHFDLLLQNIDVTDVFIAEYKETAERRHNRARRTRIVSPRRSGG